MVLVALVVGFGAGSMAAWWLWTTTRARHGGLTSDELTRLRRAELALAAAPSTETAARELGKHAMALLDAPAALVLIEGVGDTVRVETGDPHGHSLYSAGSRMRLLDDDGTPCGSIAVAPRPDRPFTERDERTLDMLAQRVSSTVHRLSLFDTVRTEQRTLSDILGSTSDGILAVGPDLHIRTWNPAMTRLTGVSDADTLGQPCCAVFRPRDEAGAPVFGGACPCRQAQPVEVLVQIDDANGAPRWLNCSFSPMSDGGSVIVARDVTARKQVDDEKADFLATVSHELRTPLTPIKGFLQTLVQRDNEFNEAQRHHIYEVMLREEQRLERLVHQLLQATSLEHAERVLGPVALEWTAIVLREVDELRRQDPARDVVVDFPDELPRVVADEQLGTQALTNLLSNAVKYSPPGSKVAVKVAVDGERVVTSVSDDGPGVAVADRERVFDKFTRLGDHLTRPQQGVGLGLYIVRRSVEAMGGTVWVDDAPSGGASFTFSLPLAPFPKPPARSPRSPVKIR